MSDLMNIRVVLVNTSHPGNIGASARAMKNMGLSQLVLVAPETFPSGVARGRAAFARDMLEDARVVSSLPEAVADCGLVIGTSARSRSVPWPMLSPRQCAARACAEAASHPVALVFGREDAGLTNAELQLCHFHTQIPTAAGCSSLNLAAAVMVLCYEICQWSRETATGGAGVAAAAPGRDDDRVSPGQDDDCGAAAVMADIMAHWDRPLASSEQTELLLEHLERVMAVTGFHDPDNPRQLLQRLRRLFARTRLDQMEVNILRGLLAQIEKKLAAARRDGE